MKIFFIQIELDCCGVDSYKDWSTVEFHKTDENDQSFLGWAFVSIIIFYFFKNQLRATIYNQNLYIVCPQSVTVS